MGTVVFMVCLCLFLCVFLHLIFVAIADGIENNDAFKHTSNESRNETWTNLLIDFQFFGDRQDHIMQMRRRFVLGAAEWMAGRNGSKQNDKQLFDYSDTDWEFIWMTMLEDGAWAVPGITDSQGNVSKANFAPEMFIKYIAHELKCHIIVFDLLLNTVQFLSGNHLKNNNVMFDSPLLLYSTGGHFQAVFQNDHEFFVRYARKLEAENDIPSNLLEETSEREIVENVKDTDFQNESEKPLVQNKDNKNCKDYRDKPMKLKENECKKTPVGFGKTQEMSYFDAKSYETEETLEFLRSIKACDRTDEQKKLMEKHRK